jgi:hypothetical protein
MTVDVEAKAKERAVLAIKEKLGARSLEPGAWSIAEDVGAAGCRSSGGKQNAEHLPSEAASK